MALSDFDLVFFGGSGDLAMRKLLPAMYARDVSPTTCPRARASSASAATRCRRKRS
jgi:glucose-6-phosphate 1-dehydrogenase